VKQLAVEAEPRLLPKLVTTVKSGTLYIDVAGGLGDPRVRQKIAGAGSASRGTR